MREVGAWLRSPRLSRAQWGVALALILVVAASRAPYLLAYGRFWAEEGGIHFLDAVTAPFPDDLLFVYSNARYYNLFPNAGTWLASEVPLEHAPLVTVWLSFGLIAVVAWVALSWPSELLPNVGARLGAALLLVVGTLADPVVWLNTLHAQVYLAIVVLLLLFVRVDQLGRGRLLSGAALLVVAGLSGLYSAALAPLFCLRAFQERTRRRIAYAVAISVPALLQVVVVLGGENTEHVEGVKASNPGAEELLRTVLVWHVSAFGFGQDNARELMQRARAGSGPTWIALVVLAAGLVVFLTALCRRLPGVRVPILLLGALVLVEILVQLGSFGEAGGRYAVLPIAILTLLVLHGAATARPGPLQWAAVGICGVVLLFGMLQFWTRQPAKLRCVDCPEWDHEVREWRDDPDDPLVVWPYDGDDRGRWMFRLPAR